MPLPGQNRFVIPVSTLYKAHRDTALLFPRPGNDVTQIRLTILEVSLHRQTARRRVCEFGLGKDRLEQAQGEVFRRITLHVEIDECAKLFGPAKERPQASGNLGYGSFGIGGLKLRIESRNFDGNV